METDYSKREIDEFRNDMKERFDKQDILLVSLNTKVGIQNGRVTKNETTIAATKMTVTIVISVVVFLFGIISSLIVYSFQLSQQNLKNDILLELKK